MTKSSFVLNKGQLDYLNYGGTGSVPLVAGEYTKAIAFKVPRQEKLELIKNPRVTCKLYDTNGDELSPNTKLMISIKKPNQELSKEIGIYKFYAEYSNLSLDKQNSTEYMDATKFEMFQQGAFPEDSELVILVNNPDGVSIDWDNADTVINIGRTGAEDLKRITM